MGTCSEGCKDEFKGSNFKLTHDTPSAFATSQWQTVCQCRYFYVIWRVVTALFFIILTVLSGVIEYDWYTNDKHRVKWFIYLTNWNIVFLTMDTIIQACVACYAISRSKQGSFAEAFPDMTWYMKTEWVVTNIATCNGVVVTLAFWAFIYSPGVDIHWVDFNTHATNTIYIIVNLFITAMPVRIYHVYHSVIFAAIYLIFSVVYELSGGTNALGYPNIYQVFDWSDDPGSAAMYAVLVGIVAELCVWLILYGFYRLRLVIYNALLARRGMALSPQNDDDKISNSVQMS